MPTARTVPIDVIATLTAFAERRGWAVEDLLAGAGVPPSLLYTERARVTEDQAVLLVQQVWRLTDDEMLGLSRHPLPRGTFRLLCYALLGAPDLRGAFDRLQGFLQAIPAIPVRIETSPEEDPTEVAVVIGTPGHGRFDRLGLSVGLGATHRLVAWMLRRTIVPLRVELPFREPESLESLRIMLDGPLVFDAPRAAVVWSADLLGSPMMRDERDIEELVAQSPRALLNPPRYRSSESEQVRRILEAGLRRGAIPSADEVAGRLLISPQTLRRRLAEEGTNLRELTENLRRDAAIEALVNSTETVAVLAERLGFSEPSAFVRAFRRWTGSTPGAYRRGSEPE